jgi:alcohol dehydrogenase (NADP+)
MKEMAEVGELATFKLPTGHHIPALGLGTWKSEPNKCREAVYAAVVEAGYRHIDCADKYGNQEEVGEALKAAMGTGIARQDLFVTSKLWCADLDPMKVKQALEKTLHELQLEYLDLYLVSDITTHSECSSLASSCNIDNFTNLLFRAAL